MNLEYAVDVKIIDDGKAISSDVLMTGLDGKLKVIGRRIAHLEDKALRDALIKLGWLPPPVVPKCDWNKSSLYALGEACIEASAMPISRIETGMALVKALERHGYEVRFKR